MQSLICQLNKHSQDAGRNIAVSMIYSINVFLKLVASKIIIIINQFIPEEGLHAKKKNTRKIIK